MPSLYPKIIIFERALNRNTQCFCSWLVNAQLFSDPAVAPVEGILRACASEVQRCVLSWHHSCHHFSCMLCLQAWLWPPAASLNPAFILTIVADALAPVWVVFLLHFWSCFFFTPFHLMFVASFSSILIVIWSLFSLEWLKILMFFSFYNCLFEKWHSMRVSNPLLSNHASCITVENCVVLLILLCRNAKTVKSSVSRQTFVISREIHRWQWLKPHCVCVHASLNFICTAFYWSIEALCH